MNTLNAWRNQDQRAELRRQQILAGPLTNWFTIFQHVDLANKKVLRKLQREAFAAIQKRKGGASA